MIGVFDSGAGGISAVRELRRLSRTLDIVFFPDRKNAPYGTRTREELIPLVEGDIELLLSLGADKVLMACCTASTVYPYLKRELREVSVPIIAPTAKAAARATVTGAVGVIATEATVRSGAFTDELKRLGVKNVTEISASPLVTIIETGGRDGSLSISDGEWLTRRLAAFSDTDIDTLILGCTHFPLLRTEIGKRLPRVKLISSSYEGALEIVNSTRQMGDGKTIYAGQIQPKKERTKKWENTEEEESTTRLQRSLQ